MADLAFYVLNAFWYVWVFVASWMNVVNAAIIGVAYFAWDHYSNGQSVPPKWFWGIAIAALFFASYHAWLREHKEVRRLRPERLSILPSVRVGVWPNNPKIYLTLSLKNTTDSWIKDCRVVVGKITKKVSERGEKAWEVQEMPHDLQLTWAPATQGEDMRSFRDKTDFDFGIIEGKNFYPRFRHPVKQIGVLAPGETFRYYIKATAENASLPGYAVCEFTWDGGGTEKIVNNMFPEENVRRHIRLKFVRFKTAESQTF